MNCPFPLAAAGAAPVAPVRDWADWERPEGHFLLPCPQLSTPGATLVPLSEKTHPFNQTCSSDYSFLSLWGQPIFAESAKPFGCFVPPGATGLGCWCPTAHLHKGGPSFGDSGVCPHQSCTNLSQPFLRRSVLTVTCSGGTLQRRLEIPLRSAGAAGTSYST